MRNPVAAAADLRPEAPRRARGPEAVAVASGGRAARPRALARQHRGHPPDLARFGRERRHPRAHGDHARSRRAGADAAPCPEPRRGAALRRRAGSPTSSRSDAAICHQVFSEEALLERQEALLAPTATRRTSADGRLRAGVGRSEMAVIWATGELWLRVPESAAHRARRSTAAVGERQGRGAHSHRRAGRAGGLYPRSSDRRSRGVGVLAREPLALANMMAEWAPRDVVSRARRRSIPLPRGRRLRRVGALLRSGDRRRDRPAASGALFPDAGAPYAAVHRFDSQASRSRSRARTASTRPSLSTTSATFRVDQGSSVT